MTTETQTTRIRTLATINHNDHSVPQRVALGLGPDGDIWSQTRRWSIGRNHDRNDWEPTGTTRGIASEDEALRTIETVWRAPSWGLIVGGPDALSLDELLDWMRANPDEDWTSLPLYGGEAIEDTNLVWSWDPSRVIVGESASAIRIDAREDR